jgi:hypothetical protein
MQVIEMVHWVGPELPCSTFPAIVAKDNYAMNDTVSAERFVKLLVLPIVAVLAGAVSGIGAVLFSPSLLWVRQLPACSIA